MSKTVMLLAALLDRYVATEHGKRSALHTEICRQIFVAPDKVARALSDREEIRKVLEEARATLDWLIYNSLFAESKGARRAEAAIAKIDAALATPSVSSGRDDAGEQKTGMEE